MADTKISEGTVEGTAALTDKFPVYKSGQVSTGKIVRTIAEVQTLIVPLDDIDFMMINTFRSMYKY